MEFESRLGVPCHVVGNSVDFAAFDGLPGPVSDEDHIVKMTYMGGLHLGRDETLGNLASALTNRQQAGRDIELHVHAPEADSTRLEQLRDQYPSVIRAGGMVEPSEVPARLASSHVLVFVESIRPEIVDFTRLSVSTKVPEYLAARRPVLALGPEAQSSVRVLRSGPATSYALGLNDKDVVRAVDEVMEMLDRPILEVDPAIKDIFDRKRSQARLRRALSIASGDKC